MSQPTLNIHFFIEGKDYGRGKILRFPSTGTSGVQWNHAFNCQLCGRQWAQAVIADNTYPAQWTFISGLCEKHSSNHTVCGSMWKHSLPDLINSFPTSVLERELNLHFKFYDEFGYGLY